jgi:hypothetical protein
MKNSAFSFCAEISFLSGFILQELRMIRDNSNNLKLVGQIKCLDGWSAKVRLEKIE